MWIKNGDRLVNIATGLWIMPKKNAGIILSDGHRETYLLNHDETTAQRQFMDELEMKLADKGLFIKMETPEIDGRW